MLLTRRFRDFNMRCQVGKSIRLSICVDGSSSAGVKNSGITSLYNPAFHLMQWSALGALTKTF